MNQITALSTFNPVSQETKVNGVDRLVAERCVETLLRYIGEDPTRDGLKDTPKRVVRALEEMTGGYHDDSDTILDTTFDLDVSLNQIVVLDQIQFTSLCEHHMLPFTGYASVGYIPNPIIEKPVVGLSKLARLVACYAQRLQVQERLTEQIADALVNNLNPLGVGVVVRAKHACMSCRGVRLEGSAMVTSAMRGQLRDCPDTRKEFLSYLKSD